MDAEKKLDTIEEEMKLLKGELKQSLTSVRDYLLNMELPSSEFSTILDALGNNGEASQKVTIDANIANNKEQPTDEVDDAIEEIVEEEVPEPEDELSLEPNDILSPEAIATSEHEHLGGLATEPDMVESGEPVGLVEPMDNERPDFEDSNNELDDIGEKEDTDDFYKPPRRKPKPIVEEDSFMEYDNSTAEQSSTPRVNLLANLINWVARAKKEIGSEQLSTFLEVYGVSGHLSPELKEAILQLCEITGEQLDAANRADIWSQSMLSLHGILTGGDAPLNPFKSSAFGTESEELPVEEEIIEVDKPKEQPVKLKLVFPDSDGKSKEFSVDLSPALESEEN